MPKQHTTVTPQTDLVDALADIIDLQRVPALDGHVHVVDTTDNAINAVVLSAVDDSEVVSFALTVS